MADYTIMTDYTINVSVVDGKIVIDPTHLHVHLDTGQDKTIDFVLPSSSDYKFLGIKIAREKSKLKHLDPYLDTEGGYYPHTCFIVSWLNTQTLYLQDKARPDFQDSGAWYYCLGVMNEEGNEIWDDPKVYNEGDAWPCLHRHGKRGS